VKAQLRLSFFCEYKTKISDGSAIAGIGSFGARTFDSLFSFRFKFLILR